MRRLAREIKATKPDTIVLATPHNLRLAGKIGVVTAENSSGTLSTSLSASLRGAKRVRLRARCDVEFAKTLLAAAERRRLPVVGANYETAEGSVSNMPMDWGTLIPLWFFLKETRVRARIVIVTPSREIPLQQNVRLGEVIAQVAERARRRVVFVASADQAHAHKASGPYSFSRAAAKYDALVVKAILEDKFQSVVRIGPALVHAAKPDSLWQMAVLAGVAKRLRMRPELYSYQVPTYYGMICAAFRR